MKLIILDRDGVINQDSDDFIKTPEEWIPIPYSLEAIASLKNSGWTVAIATNQSGISRGLFTLSVLHKIHQKMMKKLAEHRANIDYIAWCPHGPKDLCSCRKPQPGLYQQIASYFNCSLKNVPVVGDSVRDLEEAISVGAKPILVRTGKGRRSIASGLVPSATMIYDNLFSVVNELTSATDL